MVKKAKASTLRQMSQLQLAHRRERLNNELQQIKTKIMKVGSGTKATAALRKRQRAVRVEIQKTTEHLRKKLKAATKYNYRVERSKKYSNLYQVTRGKTRVVLDGIPTRDEAEAWRDDFKAGREYSPR